MPREYYIIYNPLTYNLMSLIGKNAGSNDILSWLTGLDGSKLSSSNYLKFLNFDGRKVRKGMVETLAIESYTINYLANQISRIDPHCEIYLSDGRRKTLKDIIESAGRKPKAVFITSMSSNFPAAAASAIVLNQGKIPTIIGGIHVSTSPQDIEIYIKRNALYPDLIAQVIGPGDSKVIRKVIYDLSNFSLKDTYFGEKPIEDGVWGGERIIKMNPIKMELLNRIPLIGKFLVNNIRINAITPYLGCPYSCNFCSISTLPKHLRKFTSRNPEDFLNEIKSHQKNGVNWKNRFFFFLPDNLLVGRKQLDTLLDLIIENKVKINYAAQVSINVADDIKLLKKLRKSGATHFFIGFESLNKENLQCINKPIIHDISKLEISVSDYYLKRIKIIQNHGISIHGSFIFGLPYDYFLNCQDHTGLQIENFCTKSHIGLQPCSITDLPGSLNFKKSQKENTYLYGAWGTSDYLIGMCLADLTETNKVPPDSLHNSPLLVFYMAYEAIQRAGRIKNTFFNGFFMFFKAFFNPTRNGLLNIRDRFTDAMWALISQLTISQYKDHGELIAFSRENIKGSFERLYESEKNEKLKDLFKNYISSFFSIK